MVSRRKIKVWLVSFFSMIAIFGVYSFFVKTPEIQQPGLRNGGDELVAPDLSGKPSEVAGIGIGKVGVTEFITRDEVTGKFTEVFGFEKLLNPERKNERWKLEKPYMKSFGDDSSFEVIADKGDIRVDTIIGEPSPSEGTLRGNVVVTFNSEKDGQVTQSFLYMDTLDYSSDRSEISTKGPVEFVSQDVTLEGVGMILIYNTGLDRIEYFKISELGYLNIYKVDSLQEDSSDEAVLKEKSGGEVAVLAEPVEKSAAALEPVPDKPVKDEPVDSVLSKSASKEAGTFYQCSFFDNVLIKRLDNLFVKSVESVNIVNIFYGGSGGRKSGAASDVGDAALADKKVKKDAAVSSVDEGALEAATKDVSVEVADQDAVVIEIEKDRVPEVVVTCSGPLVVVPIKPTDGEAASDGRPVVMKLPEGSSKGRVGRVDEASEFAEEAGPDDTRFDAVNIDYDISAGRAYAGGPVKFTFYSKPDPNALDPDALIPMVINADDNAEYFDDEKKINFNGNVTGVSEDIRVDFVQNNAFYGDKLAVHLHKATPEAKELSVRHVAVTGEKVKFKSTRMVGEEVINQIQLFRSRIDYEGVGEVVTAGEGGRIEINNSNAPVPDSDEGKKKSMGLEGPCYAVIENFESLVWFLKGNTVIAKGEKSGVEVGYIPIVDGQPGSAIQTTAKHIIARFDTSKTKRAKLVTLTARDGIHYREVDGNEFVGDSLLYDGATEVMVVSGMVDKPCFVNGVETDRIEYNLGSGKVNTSISSRPGTISVPRRRRR